MLTEQQKSHARFISIFEGVAATVWGQFTGGFGGNSYLAGFFLWIGASPFSMALYGAMVPLANIFQPIVLWISSRVGSRKRLVVVLAGIGRPTFLALALFALVKGGLRVELALLLFLLFELATSSVGAPWQSWMSDLVDPPLRGSYFGRRNLATGLVSVPSALLAGYLLDLLGRQFLAFLALFAVGSIFGALDVFFLTRQDEDDRHTDPPLRLGRLPHIFRFAGEYRAYLGAMVLVNFSGSLMGPYATVMMIRSFHYNYATLGLLTVTGSLAGALCQPLWGRLGDRYGHLRMLKSALVLRVILPIGWALSVPSLLYMIPLQVAIGIIVNAGMGLLSFNTLLALAPRREKIEAFSLYASVTNAASFAGNIASGLVLLPFLSVAGHFLAWTLNPYRFVFLASMVFRLVAAWYVVRLRLTRVR